MTKIRENILSGTWSRGFQLAGELHPAWRRGVSVITVRQAWRSSPAKDLSSANVPKRFVNWSGPVKQAINLETEAGNLVTLNPEGTSFKLLATRKIEPGAALQRVFKLPANEKITRMTRVRMAQGRPLAYVHSYVASRIAGKLSPRSLLELPLSNAIGFGIKITDVKHLIGAKLVDAEISAHVQISAGSPVLFVERNYFCKKELVLRTTGFYRSDLFRYELKLKRGSVKPS